MNDPDTDRNSETETPFLERFLAEREVPCPSCGYNLRALRGNRCPECGSALRLSVGLARPISIAWIVGLVFAGMGFAGAGVFMAVALIAAPRGWLWESISGILMTALTPICGVLIALLLIFRRRYSRLPPTKRRVIGAMIATIVVATLALIIVLFDER